MVESAADPQHRGPQGPDTDPRLVAAVEKIRAGEDPEASFRIVMDRFYRPVQLYFQRRVSSAEDGLDLTQETFLKIYKGLPGFRWQSRLSTWIFRIARNEYLKWLGARRSGPGAREVVKDDLEEVAMGASSTASAEVSPFDRLQRHGQRQALHSAAAELPPQMRHCLHLRLEQELSYRQIATVMQISIETVKAHLFQARRKLKDHFEELEPSGRGEG